MPFTTLFKSFFGSRTAERQHSILPWVMENTERVYGLRRIDWRRIHERVNQDFSEDDPDELWCNIAYSWLHALREDLGDAYTIRESDNFILLSFGDEPYNKALLSYLENSRRRLLRFLDGVAQDDGVGKFVVMVFEDANRYYDYVSHFGSQDGTFGMSSGMFVGNGYGHLIFPHNDIGTTELVAAHEMSHALVSHLELPLWLNEGIAVNMESALKGINSSPISHHHYARHQEFWNEQTIQEFWSGESFGRPDEGQELSYQLARILVQNLVEQQDEFVQFCNAANWKDAGERALNRSYDLSLQDLLANFLGEGRWLPRSQAG